MTTVHYRGFDILARPYQLNDSRLWTIEFEIRHNGGRQPFTLKERYCTEADAERRCTGIGRLIIDGKVPGWSVDHLRAYKPELTRQLFVLSGILIVALGFVLILHRTDLRPWPMARTVGAVDRMGEVGRAMLGGVVVLAGLGLVVAGGRRRA